MTNFIYYVYLSLVRALLQWRMFCNKYVLQKQYFDYDFEWSKLFDMFQTWDVFVQKLPNNRVKDIIP